MVFILINKGVFEPSYEDSKFRILKPQLLLHQPKKSTLSGKGRKTEHMIQHKGLVIKGHPPFLRRHNDLPGAAFSNKAVTTGPYTGDAEPQNECPW